MKGYYFVAFTNFMTLNVTEVHSVYRLNINEMGGIEDFYRIDKISRLDEHCKLKEEGDNGC